MPEIWLSIIALCHNHERFVKECLQSVFTQNYPFIELLIVDDASTDQSVKIIEQWIQNVPNDSFFKKNIKFYKIQENIGNCKAFNLAFRNAKGKYIIDLATDDILSENQIFRQIQTFETQAQDVGIVFSNAYLINEKSEMIGQHFKEKDTKNIPNGLIYKYLIEKSFISAPSMIIRKKVLEELNGYDENLSYEDYDFWIRSSRNWKYYFLNEILVKKRVLSNSHGKTFYMKNNPHLKSTLKVCKKAFLLNQNQEEHLALAVSVRYHARLSLFTSHFDLVLEFAELLKKLDKLTLKDKICIFLAKIHFPVNLFYDFYRKIRNK